MFPFSLSSDFKAVIITDILHYYSVAHTEGLLRPLYEQVHTQVFIHSNTVPIQRDYCDHYTNKYIHRYSFIPIRYQYSMYCCRCAFLQLMSLSRNYVDQYNAKKSTTGWANHQQHNYWYILIATEKCTDVPICWTTFPPQAVELCKIRAGRTTACRKLFSVRPDPSFLFLFSP